MIERPYLIGDILHIDREPVLKLLPTVRPTLAERIDDLFIGDPGEVEELEEELAKAERRARGAWALVDFWASHHHDLVTALREVVKLLEEDEPHAARRAARTALGERP